MENRGDELRKLVAKETTCIAELELIAAELRSVFRKEGSDRLREEMRKNHEALTWARTRLEEHTRELDYWERTVA